MSKINKDEPKEKQEIRLTYPQVQSLAKEVLDAGGKEAFLLKKRVITVDKGEWVVMHYEGLKNADLTAVFDFKYESDVPYDLWNVLLQEVDNFLRYKEQKEKEQNASLEKLAESI